MLAFLVFLDIHFQCFLILGGYYVYASCLENYWWSGCLSSGWQCSIQKERVGLFHLFSLWQFEPSMQAWKALVHKNQMCYLVCNKPIITHKIDTLNIYFRFEQPWVPGGIPQIKHTSCQSFLLLIHFNKQRNYCTLATSHLALLLISILFSIG